MNRFIAVGCHIALGLLLGAASAHVEAQEHSEEFTNLQVLPKDISPEQLDRLMDTFTRALGVRCIHCHVGEEGKPFEHGAFAKDDKPTKATARAMILMTQDLNDKYLANLASRSEPPVRVQCATCHHGVTQPRALQDILETAYQAGGLDSTLTRYNALRNRYYGRYSYDFGEVPLADVASRVRAAGHPMDAEQLLSLNVEMNPKSAFAKRRYATAALASAFTASADSGAAAYHHFKETYGDSVITEGFVNNVGYDLLGADQTDAAIAVFELNVAENPKSGNVYDSLGEAYLKKGNKKKAISAYETSLKLDPENENAVEKLGELKGKSKKGGKSH